MSLIFFFFNDTATTEIYTLSLHDALPISPRCLPTGTPINNATYPVQTDDMKSFFFFRTETGEDRKSTRLNSSHANISYAVFCLKKKKTTYDARGHDNYDISGLLANQSSVS